MSGTSLDGLDICAVDFVYSYNQWGFEILNSETIKYSSKLIGKFRRATTMTSSELLSFDIEFGRLIGKLTKQFIVSNRLKVDFIASHGHTVFHQPENNFTLQIGCGQSIAIETGLPVVYDFRTKDVSLGGQGAPLVPIGDRELFSEFHACINLGGIANISFESNGVRTAFDICPFNMGLNFLANKIDLEYDEGGKNASKGKVDLVLLEKLNQLEFYSMAPPKSLGVEWFEEFCLPLLDDSIISIEDRLATFSEHIASQIVENLNEVSGEQILITGGGAYNDYVINLVQLKTSKTILRPPNDVVDFKEALIFAFLGVLKINGQINVLKSATGGMKDSSSGVVVLP